MADAFLSQLPWIRRLARGLMGQDGDDLVQEAWLIAHRDEPQEDAKAGLRPWLARAMRNRAVSLQRSAEARKRREHSTTAASVRGPEAAAMEAELVKVLDKALASLTQGERALVLDRFAADRSTNEIAETLGVPAATVRTRLRRSLLRLRSFLTEQHGSDRRAWAPAVLALPSTKTALGGVAMATVKGFMAAGVIAVAAVVAIAWASGRDETQSEAPTAGDGSVAAGVGEATAGEIAGHASASEVRTVRAQASGNDTPSRRAGSVGSLSANARGPAPGDQPTMSAAEIRECATAAHKHDCDFLEPDDAVLDEMAKCGTVRYDFPAMFAQRDWTPEFETEWLNLVGATDAEGERLMQISDGYREELFGGLETLAGEVGAGPFPTDATLLDVVVEISKAVGDDNVRAASRRVAQERAGHADPPADLAELPAAERFLRSFSAVGTGFEDAIAKELGAARARELHIAQDGWPGLKYQTGSRCD